MANAPGPGPWYPHAGGPPGYPGAPPGHPGHPGGPPGYPPGRPFVHPLTRRFNTLGTVSLVLAGLEIAYGLWKLVSAALTGVVCSAKWEASITGSRLGSVRPNSRTSSHSRPASACVQALAARTSEIRSCNQYARLLGALRASRTTAR